MAMMIVFIIFALFWVGMTLASLTYMVFRSSRNLMNQLENHTPFWLQSYYAFLDRYHKPLLFGSVALGVGLTVWGLTKPNHRHTSCDFPRKEVVIKVEESNEGTFYYRRSCRSRHGKSQARYMERSASPFGGIDNLYAHVSRYRYTPESGMGTVYVQFFVQEDGSLEDVSVISGINREIDNEAIRLIQSYEAGWEPALYHGQTVEQRVVIPIPF